MWVLFLVPVALLVTVPLAVLLSLASCSPAGMGARRGSAARHPHAWRPRPSPAFANPHRRRHRTPVRPPGIVPVAASARVSVRTSHS